MVLAGMISTPYLAWYCFQVRRMQPHVVAWLVAGIFTLLTVGSGWNRQPLCVHKPLFWKRKKSQPRTRNRRD